jgi:MoaA/NifB/PqqE/SkfB family radical SAM enzyme
MNGSTALKETAIQRLKSPIRVNFELTEACNLACAHCYNYWGYASTGKRLVRDRQQRDLDHFLRILDILITQGVRVITFTGGEPFMRKDLLYPLVEHAKNARLRVLVNTNATLITQGEIDKITTLGIDGFLVSLLSGNESTHNDLAHTNSYSRTMKGIELLVTADQFVTVNMVCSTKNYLQVRGTAIRLAGMNVFAFSATPMLPSHLAPEHATLHLSRN